MMMLGNCCALFPVSDLVLVGGEVQRRLESSLCAKLYSEKRGDTLEKNLQVIKDYIYSPKKII